jgi:hypothetical protein
MRITTTRKIGVGQTPSLSGLAKDSFLQGCQDVLRQYQPEMSLASTGLKVPGWLASRRCHFRSNCHWKNFCALREIDGLV